MLIKFKPPEMEGQEMGRGKKSQVLAGLVLVTLGALLLLHRLLILNFYTTSWPLLLVAVGLGFFLINHHTWAGWIIGGIGVILFVVNFAIVFFPGVEAWSDLVGPIILVIIGALLLYRFSHNGLPPKL
jgi:putative Mn2+ efflux pump MntP